MIRGLLNEAPLIMKAVMIKEAAITKEATVVKETTITFGERFKDCSLLQTLETRI